MKLFNINAAIVCTILAIAPAGLQAAPGHHPAYLHALEDLRHARANLERGGGDHGKKWDEQTAIREIDAAIREIREAAIDDGKRLDEHPLIDFHMEWGGRLRRAVELLEKADRDVREEEDRSFGHGLQERALMHIHEAIRFTKDGIGR